MSCLRDNYARWRDNVDNPKYSFIASFIFESALVTAIIEISGKRNKAIGATEWFDYLDFFLEFFNVAFCVNKFLLSYNVRPID